MSNTVVIVIIVAVVALVALALLSGRGGPRVATIETRREKNEGDDDA